MRSRARRFIGSWALPVGRPGFGCWLFLTTSVSQLFAQSNPNALPALSPIYPEIQPTFWERDGIAVVIAGIVFFILVGLIVWLLRRPRPAVTVPAAVVAREALAGLLRQPENGNVLSEISQILRRYLIAAFGFPAAELTTAEFSAVLAGSQKISAELAQAISSFLRECDQRKFAPINPNHPLNAAARALELVELAERHRVLESASVPVTTTAPPPVIAGSSQTSQKLDAAASKDGGAPQ